VNPHFYLLIFQLTNLKSVYNTYVNDLIYKYNLSIYY